MINVIWIAWALQGWAGPQAGQAPSQPLTPSVVLPAGSERARVIDRIVTRGPGRGSVERLYRFLERNRGRQYVQETYTCQEWPESIRPCHPDDRQAAPRSITLKPHPYAVLIDFSRPSTERRFHLIRVADGEVESFYVSHGKGSGKDDLIPVRFSNTLDSKQTSLGFYMGGEIYKGRYGETLRMYGLQPSNSRAYVRDIVLHGAYYATERFMNSLNPATQAPFGRLGVSWGCPAVAPSAAKRLVHLLKDGGVIFHDHPVLLDAAQSGQPVEWVPPSASLAAPSTSPEPSEKTP